MARSCGVPGQREEFAFYSDLWNFKARPQHCNDSFPRIFQFSAVSPKAGTTNIALRPEFLGLESRCPCPGGK